MLEEAGHIRGETRGHPQVARKGSQYKLETQSAHAHVRGTRTLAPCWRNTPLGHESLILNSHFLILVKCLMTNAA